MAPVVELPAAYVEVRDRLRIHLHQIRKAVKKHPEYTVALVVAVASEVLGRLQGLGPAVVFKMLLHKRGAPAPVAHGLFRAVRNGLAHRYDTCFIDAGGPRAVVVVKWSSPGSHLNVKVADWLHDGVPRPGVVLCTETLWQDLLDYIRQLERRMRHSPALVRTVRKKARQLDRRYGLTPQGQALAEWQLFLRRGGTGRR